MGHDQCRDKAWELSDPYVFYVIQKAKHPQEQLPTNEEKFRCIYSSLLNCYCMFHDFVSNDIAFTNMFLPTDSLFLPILLVKQHIKLKWPY